MWRLERWGESPVSSMSFVLDAASLHKQVWCSSQRTYVGRFHSVIALRFLDREGVHPFGRTPLIGPPAMRAVVGVDRTPFWCLGSAAAEITRWRASLLGRAGSRGVPHPTGRSSWRRVPTGRRRRRRRSVARSPTGRG